MYLAKDNFKPDRAFSITQLLFIPSMASFLEDLWTSVFTPGPTPTLLVATNATFAALQFLLLVLLVATRSVHFVVLSALSGGLWYSINWFAREMQAEAARADKEQERKRKEKSSELGSDTETETPLLVKKTLPKQAPLRDYASSSLKPSDTAETLRRRRSLGDSSGYVSTDSEWDKVSEGDKEI